MIFFLFDITVVEISISSKKIPDDFDVLQNLKPGIPQLLNVYQARDARQNDDAIKLLTDHLKEKAADRYYFSWKSFKQRFKQYQSQYPKKRKEHFNLANEQITTYPPETHWILPFKNLKDDEVTAYELRHLARQQKSFDMALMFYYFDKDKKYLDYWVRQVADLNHAFSKGAYDDAGNGVYESFRAGKRIHNRLLCHHAYLASEKYDWKSQLLLIKTFLHHGAQLQKRTLKYRQEIIIPGASWRFLKSLLCCQIFKSQIYG